MNTPASIPIQYKNRTLEQALAEWLAFLQTPLGLTLWLTNHRRIYAPGGCNGCHPVSVACGADGVIHTHRL